MIARVRTALPRELSDDGRDRAHEVLLDCGHQARVWGARGKRPKRGAPVRCRKCAEVRP